MCRNQQRKNERLEKKRGIKTFQKERKKKKKKRIKQRSKQANKKERKKEVTEICINKERMKEKRN